MFQNLVGAPLSYEVNTRSLSTVFNWIKRHFNIRNCSASLEKVFSIPCLHNRYLTRNQISLPFFLTSCMSGTVSCQMSTKLRVSTMQTQELYSYANTATVYRHFRIKVETFFVSTRHRPAFRYVMNLFMAERTVWVPKTKDLGTGTTKCSVHILKIQQGDCIIWLMSTARIGFCNTRRAGIDECVQRRASG
jgi:hypothetical protein